MFFKYKNVIRARFQFKNYPFICLKNLDVSRFFKQIN